LAIDAPDPELMFECDNFAWGADGHAHLPFAESPSAPPQLSLIGASSSASLHIELSPPAISWNAAATSFGDRDRRASSFRTARQSDKVQPKILAQKFAAIRS
jgi:hypothetical protein